MVIWELAVAECSIAHGFGEAATERKNNSNHVIPDVCKDKLKVHEVTNLTNPTMIGGCDSVWRDNMQLVHLSANGLYPSVVGSHGGSKVIVAGNGRSGCTPTRSWADLSSCAATCTREMINMIARTNSTYASWRSHNKVESYRMFGWKKCSRARSATLSAVLLCRASCRSSGCFSRYARFL